MQLSTPTAKLNYDSTDPDTVSNVIVTFQISELFESTSAPIHEVSLTILPSEYEANIAPDSLLTLVKSKLKERFSDGSTAIHLLNVNYGSLSINFVTADSDKTNTINIKDTLTLIQADMDTALAAGISGLNDAVKNKLVAEFTDTTTTTTTTA